MNLCRRCKQDFGSVGAFDSHRVGKHEYLWTEEMPDGRRCLDVDELVNAGWKQDKFNRWRQPISEDALVRIREMRSRTETA